MASREQFSAKSASPVDIPSRPDAEIAALTRRLVAGDEMAYRTFHDAYFGRLSRYLLVATRGDEVAMRDALQETFTRVVRHVRMFNDEDVFWSWLTVLARSALFDAGRKRSRYQAFLDCFRRQHLDTRPSRESAHRADDELMEALERNLMLLPAEERRLLEWKYFERQPVRVIADALQTTEKAVESQLGRVRRKLKQMLLAQLHDGSGE